MNNWYESSIKSLVEEYFKEHGFSVVFDSSEFWDVFIEKYHKQIPSSQIALFDQIATEARSYAFNKKYGTYSYLTDYRSVCRNWNHIILDEIQKILGKNLSSKKVLALGANNGSELAIIFEDFFKSMDFDVVEISETACSSGMSLYPHINFVCTSMDEVGLLKMNLMFLSVCVLLIVQVITLILSLIRLFILLSLVELSSSLFLTDTLIYLMVDIRLLKDYITQKISIVMKQKPKEILIG